MGDRGSDSADAPERAVRYLLHTARRRLDMEAAFLAELTETEQIYRATTGRSATSFTVLEGGRLPRIEGYCRRVMESDAPWVIRDTGDEPAVRELAVTEAGRFGAYLGVPVRLPDGSPFGTLCCIHHTPRPELGDQDVAIMEALADMLGFHVAQLADHEAAIGDLQDYVEELADDLGEHELRVEVFRHLVDASPDPTLLLRPDSFEIEYANAAAAELVDGERTALVGVQPWHHHRCWDETTLRRQLERLGDGESTVAYELAPIDGAPAMDAQLQRFSTEAGTDFLLWQGHDVTPHRESQRRLNEALTREQRAGEELRKLDQRRDAFLTAVSHELRTPLTIVMAATETLRAGRADADQARTLLDRLHDNATRLDRMLADLLDLNRFAHGRLDIERVTRRLDDLVRSAVAEVELGERSLELHLEPLEAEVAPMKIERIVANLVTNACVHTPAGTRIDVHLRLEGDAAHLVVADDGPGVPEDLRTGVFEPFRQGRTAPAHRPGAGIGLSLVAAFTELHGGRTWVEESPNGGAAMHVVLPLTLEASTRDGAPTTQDRGTADHVARDVTQPGRAGRRARP